MEKEKNIWIIPTNKPSRLAYVGDNGLCLGEIFLNTSYCKPQNIYITSDEQIKLNDFITDGYFVWKWKDDSSLLGRKKIILSTDQELIDDGVEKIDNTFLEVFVRNPNCEKVKIHKYGKGQSYEYTYFYELNPSKEEPKQETEKSNLDKHLASLPEYPGTRRSTFVSKQETLEEAAQKRFPIDLKADFITRNISLNATANFGFIEGARWQAERSYSEVEVGELIYNIFGEYGKHCDIMIDGEKLNNLFEQFKKK